MRNDEEAWGVILVHAIHHVFELEKALKRLSVETRPIPVPRHLSSDCGTALAFRRSDREAVDRAIRETNLEIAGIHNL